MLNVTKITANKTNDRLVFIASAPDDALRAIGVTGAMKEVLATVVLETANANVVAPTLDVNKFVITDVDGGFGTVAAR